MVCSRWIGLIVGKQKKKWKKEGGKREASVGIGGKGISVAVVPAV